MRANNDWRTRGKQFELAEKAEWQGVTCLRVLLEYSLSLREGNRGRIDILIEEQDTSQTIIEVKATDWDAMAEHRVRPNVLRHARQVMKYVYPFWERGKDVCPGITYPHAPSSAKRQQQVEDALEQRSIQVVWFNERGIPS